MNRNGMHRIVSWCGWLVLLLCLAILPQGTFAAPNAGGATAKTSADRVQPNTIDQNRPPIPALVDNDNDGVPVPEDCDDNQANVHPAYPTGCTPHVNCVVEAAVELCDGRDNNCNGTADENFPIGQACVVGTGDCSNTGQYVCTSPTTYGCDVTYKPDNTNCGDAGTECVNQDKCQGGVCQDNGFKAGGTACGDPSGTGCNAPDTCDGAGNCVDRKDVAGTPCDDGLFCTVNDVCDGAGGCATTPTARDCGVPGAGGVIPVNFEPATYAPGNINGQDGWSKTGGYDVNVVSNTYGIGSFGTQTLQISDAVTAGSFGDQTFSKPLPNEVGESAADNGGMSGGSRKTHFEAEWDFASAVPGAEQAGMLMSSSADRGDGARMTYLRYEDKPAGIEVYFDDYQDVAPYGAVNSETDGCSGTDDFTETLLTTLDRTIPHHFKLTLDTVEGPHNDVVKVYIDGVLVHTGTSWEDYYRWCAESNPGYLNDNSRTVDSLLFRVAGDPHPADAGKGFLIDNLRLQSGLGDACNTAVCNEGADTCDPVAANEGGACGDPDGTGCNLPDTCASGVCVDNIRAAGYVCRAAAGDCDAAEVCDGTIHGCPPDGKLTDALASLTFGFENPPFNPGSIDGQQGWSGGNIAINPSVDQGVDQSGSNAYAGVGSWRISNQGYNGNFNGWPFSTGLSVLAGQPSSGAGADEFNATFYFRAANPVADGSAIEIDLGTDSGDDRNTFLSLRNLDDANGGLILRAAESDVAAGAGNGYFWPTQIVSTHLSRTAWHRIDIVAKFYNGDNNDTFEVALDGVTIVNPRTSLTTWGTFEGYRNGNGFPYAKSNRLFWRSGASPSDLGFPTAGAQGFYFDEVSYRASNQSSHVCRASAGVCDLVEVCDGSGNDCPVDAKSTAVCRGSAGICDVVESCDGLANDCPGDAFQPASNVCRGAANQCDAIEYCTGSGPACPADVNKPNGTSCTDGNFCTTPDTCQTGVCTPGSTPAGDLYVANGGSDAGPNSCQDSGSPCATIQHAIDAACADGLTIHVAAGSYAENVVVTKAVTILGAGCGATTVYPAISAPNPCAGSSLCGGAASNVFLIQANNVTIAGLTIDGDNPGLSGLPVGGADIDARNGIITNHALGVYQNLVVHDTCVQNVYLRGVYASSGGSFNLHHNTVTNVQGDPASIGMFNFGGSGTMAYNQVSQANDAVSSNWSTGTVYDHNTITTSGSGVHSDNNGGSGGTGDTLSNNTVTNCRPNGYGVWTFAPYVAISVHDNTVTNCAVGLAAAGQQDPAGVTTFVSNFITGTNDPTGAGVYVTTSLFGFGSSDVNAVFGPGNVIRNNVIGFYLEREANQAFTVTASCNRIIQNGEGIYVAYDLPTPSTVQFHDNVIAGNTTDGANGTAVTAGSIDCENNWWGCAAGPGNAGCDTVTAGVDAAPSLSSAPACTPCAGAPDGQACDDSNACTTNDTCQSGVCVGGTAPNCDDANPCTVDSCIAPTGCNHAAGNAGALCRASAGQCDVAETCTGLSPTCPVDGFAANTVACTGSSQGGICDNDPADRCAGANVSNTCVDAYQPVVTICRVDAGQCDVAEYCTGSSGACPADAFEPATTQCSGPSQGAACDDDANDRCTGSGNVCVDAFKSASTVCRASSGVCDVAETCTGTSGACPANVVQPNTFVCRPNAPATQCDAPESCTGGAGDTIYDSISNMPGPGPQLPPNVDSLGYQATQTGEFGDDVTFAGTSRFVTDVAVTMSTWARHSDWPLMGAAGWNHSITLKIYNVNAGPTAGSLIGTYTQNFDIPWRPEADPGCGDSRWKASDGLCYNGYAFNVTFPVNTTLPDRVIYSVVYNTQSYGPAPLGVAGPYNSLNLGLRNMDTPTAGFGLPPVGTDTNTDDVFWNTATVGYYTPGGGCTGGTFCRDTVWFPYTPAVRFNAVQNGSTTCPTDVFQPATTSCTGVLNGGACDGADHCAGTNVANACVDTYLTSVCRPASGQCDVAESCTGLTSTCPVDGYAANTVACTGSSQAGACDDNALDRCAGANVANACVDAFKPSGTICRADAGQCDVAETCTGVSGACPVDGFEPDGTTCSDADKCTGPDVCSSGNCVGPTLLTVSPNNMNGWGFFDDNTDGPGTGNFTAGPSTPPLGAGSVHFLLNAFPGSNPPADRQIVSTYAYGGTALASITRLEYSTYRASTDAGNNLAITLQFDIDYDGAGGNAAYQGRLVFEPYQSFPGGVPQNTWQTWSPLAGTWWATRAPGNGPCGQGTPCTWGTILANWPNATIHASIGGSGIPGRLILKAGGPTPSFEGSADRLIVGVSGVEKTYDFEAADLCSDGNDCTTDTCVANTCINTNRPDATTVAAGNMNGWAAISRRTAAAAFIPGPPTPPLGDGSYLMATGPGGSGPQLPGGGDSSGTGGKTWLGTEQFNGTLLSAITALRYSTYISASPGGISIAPAINIYVDLDGNGSRDTTLVFEPVYTYGNPTPGTWQTWDAYAGGTAKWWYTTSFGALNNPSNDFRPLSDYFTLFPNAKIVSWYSPGNPFRSDGWGTNLVAGMNGIGAPWNSFVGYVDNFTLSTAATPYTADFEPASLCGDSNACTQDQCGGGMCVHPSSPTGTACGDNTETTCNHADTCNGAGSCGSNFEAATTTCRASAGVCDLAELCDGAGSCPPVDAKSTAVCRPVAPGLAGQCDVAESCDGVSNDCPADGYQSAAALCTGASQGGACDGVDHCAGANVANSCVDVYQPSTTVCRDVAPGLAGQCDVAELCTGASGACPADAFQPNTTTCTGASNAGACDTQDYCLGTANTCVDKFLSAGTVCRADAGQCDVAEVCPGSSGACPADAFEPNTTLCVGPSQGDACDDDANDRCTGADNTCVDAFKSNATECRASAGDCDIAETCTGTAGACPADVVQPNTYVCRPNAPGTQCDVPDYCTGGAGGGGGAGVVIYDSIPGPTLPPSVPSLGYQANQTFEFGDDITFAGTQRFLTDANVMMVTWAPRSDWPVWPTTPGDPSSWQHPITLNIYAVLPGPVPQAGALLHSVTQTMNIPWRPAADPACGTAWKAGDGGCYNGYAFNIDFTLNWALPPGVDRVIYGIAYNTETWGAAPMVVGGPYDSLNLGLRDMNAPAAGYGLPSVGTDNDTGDVIWNTATLGWYTPGGGCQGAPNNTFCRDTLWFPYTPAVRFNAVPAGSVSCPADAFAPDTTNCNGTSTGGACDTQDQCAGTSNTCVDKFLPNTTICRGVAPGLAGQCDVAELCTGGSGTCPADQFQPVTATCTGAVNGHQCDATDHCAGVNASNTCVDVYQPSGTSCNDSNVCTSYNGVPATGDQCNETGVCNGLAVVCPDEIPANSCTIDECVAVTGCQHTPNCGINGLVVYNKLSAPSTDAPAGDPTNPIGDATLTLTGAASGSTLSSNGPNPVHGAYSFSPVAGNISDTPTRNASSLDLARALDSSDPSLISKRSVGLVPPFSTRQFKAGDVSANGSISAFDAALVSQRLLSIITTWPAPLSATTWFFDPIVRSLTVDTFASSPYPADFVGVVYGDVSMGWTDPTGDDSFRVNHDGMPAQWLLLDPAQIQQIVRPAGVTSNIYVSQAPVAQEDGSYVMVLGMTQTDGIIGMNFALKFDPRVVTIQNVKPVGLAELFAIDSTVDSEGAQQLSIYSPAPMQGTGDFLAIKMTIDGALGGLPFELTGNANEGAVGLSWLTSPMDPTRHEPGGPVRTGPGDSPAPVGTAPKSGQ